MTDPEIPKDADWADLTPEQTDYLLGGLDGLKARVEQAHQPVVTRSGVLVTRAQHARAVTEAAARDDANHRVRSGVRASEQSVFDTAAEVLAATPTLAGFLTTHIVVAPKHIENLIALETKLLVTAQSKAGKTVFTANMVKSLVDETPFLNAHAVSEPLGGKAVIVDAEMPTHALQSLYARLGVKEQESVVLHALRESEHRRALLRLTDERTQALWTEHLLEVGAKAFFIDPIADVMHACDLDEDGATSWLAVQEAIDTICIDAGVGVRVLCHHSGWDNARGRGSSRQYDWPDSIVVLTRDGATGDSSVPRHVSWWGRHGEQVRSRIWLDPLDQVTLTLGAAESLADSEERKKAEKKTKEDKAERERRFAILQWYRKHDAKREGLPKSWPNNGERSRAKAAADCVPRAAEGGPKVAASVKALVEEGVLVEVDGKYALSADVPADMYAPPRVQAEVDDSSHVVSEALAAITGGAR